MSFNIRALLVTLILALAMRAPMLAQATNGTISGTVTDESKAVLPGVTVQVKNVETGATRTLVTDDRGGFRALNLAPGLSRAITPAGDRRSTKTSLIGV